MEGGWVSVPDFTHKTIKKKIVDISYVCEV
jgi:hypothetical protein